MKIRAICLSVVLSLCVFGASVLLAGTTSNTQSLLAASSAAENKSSTPVSQESLVASQNSSQNQPQITSAFSGNSSPIEVMTAEQMRLAQRNLGQTTITLDMPPMLAVGNGTQQWPMVPPPWMRGFDGRDSSYASNSDLSDLARDQARIIGEQSETIRMLQSQLMGRASAEGDRGNWRHRDVSLDDDSQHSDGHIDRQLGNRNRRNLHHPSNGSSDDRGSGKDSSYPDKGWIHGIVERNGERPRTWMSPEVHSQDPVEADSNHLSFDSDNVAQPTSVVVQVAGSQEKDVSAVPVDRQQDSAAIAQQVLAPVVAQAQLFLPTSSSPKSLSDSSAGDASGSSVIARSSSN